MIKFLDLNKFNLQFEPLFQDKLKQIVSEGTLILGSEVEHFESSFADFCGTKHCIGVANGLDALSLIFQAYLDKGVLKKGDEIIVPANTFMASILSILNTGLKPVLVEPEEESFNVSVDTIKTGLTSKTKAVLVVHLYGQLAPMDQVFEFAKSNSLLVIEDAAQAHGAENSEGKRAGNLSDAAAFSFYPAKNLGALGDGGAITTNNSELNQLLRLLRNYGSSKKYEFDSIGVNSRLDELQAGFLNVKLPSLDEHNDRRREIASLYLNGIKNDRIQLPNWNRSKDHVFYVFVIRVEERKRFVEYLESHQIGYHIHYPKPPHQQKAISKLFSKSFPITEAIHKTVLSLPLNPILKDSEVIKIINLINSWK